MWHNGAVMRFRILLPLAAVCGLWAQTAPPAAPAPSARAVPADDYDDRQAQSLRAAERPLWYLRMGDLAEVDEVDYTSLPPVHIGRATIPGAGNPLIVHAWTFVPKSLDRSRKQPLLVFPHGGVHSRFSIGSLHIVREMVAQGYSVIAPDYRGSTGYGTAFYRAIDYGGRENDDVLAARAWMLETYPFLDGARVGLVGWSHGGMIALMNVFAHP
jgi:dipeptidyl aminopeptidase/acylaminoacyl peptidase